MIAVDALLALVLAAVFVSGITAATLEARQMFDRARDRSALIAAYAEHRADFDGLLPYETRSKHYLIGSTTEAITIEARTTWYGNDRIETHVSAAYRGRSVTFRTVKNYPFQDISESAGTPLCTVDMSDDQTVSPSIAIIPVALPIDPLLPLIDIEVRNGIAYISIDSTVASDPDFIVVDIKDPKQPNLLSSVNTGPGLTAFALAGKYVFAAAASTAAQLHVIRLDSLTSTVLAKKYKLPLPEASTTPPTGSTIFYDKGKIYLGTGKWDGEELSILDVSNPEGPIMVDGFETGSKVNDVIVRAGIAYLAASDSSQLRSIDIRDAGYPLLLETFSPSGSDRQEGKVLVYFEDGLHLGRTSGGFNIKADHELFRFPSSSSTPSAYEPNRPPDIAQSENSRDIPGGVYGIIASRSHVYVATRNIDRELTILSVSLSSTTASYYPLPVAPQAMTCDLDHLYILAKTAPVIYEVDLKKQ
ncbi:MAG: hypothetical protein WCV82_00020 [Candidatus Paceibacterota bacterium]